MNKRVYNALRKIAAEPEVKETKSEVPFNATQYWLDRSNAASSDRGARRSNINTKEYEIQPVMYPHYKHYFTTINQSDYIHQRPRVANWLSQHFMGLTPGSDEFNQAVKYFMDRGKTNMYNHLNPSNPRQNPAVPEIFKDREDEMKSLGNTIGSNNYGKKYSDIG